MGSVGRDDRILGHGRKRGEVIGMRRKKEALFPKKKKKGAFSEHQVVLRLSRRAWRVEFWELR